MSNLAIAAEVAGAYREVAREVGDGDATATLIVGVTQTTPWGAPSGTETEYKATAYQPKLDLSKIDGTLILASDLMLDLVEPEIVPTTAMRLRWKGVTYRIQMVWPFAPSGAAISYLVQARV